MSDIYQKSKNTIPNATLQFNTFNLSPFLYRLEVPISMKKYQFGAGKFTKARPWKQFVSINNVEWIRVIYSLANLRERWIQNNAHASSNAKHRTNYAQHSSASTVTCHQVAVERIVGATTLTFRGPSILPHKRPTVLEINFPTRWLPVTLTDVEIEFRCCAIVAVSVVGAGLAACAWYVFCSCAPAFSASG